MRLFSIAWCTMIMLCAALCVFSANPAITGIYLADPSAHVGPDGQMWVYPSHDRDNAVWWDQSDWHVFSSSDLVNWVDYGKVLAATDFSFAQKFAWAPDCIYKSGKYYFYAPVSTDANFGNTNAIGVAVGDFPQGPFTPQSTALVTGYPQGFDPAVFIDDDGQAYLYCGQQTAYVAKLKPSMIELAEPLQVIQGATLFFEGPWMFKRNGVYYFMYPEGASSGLTLGYCMGSSPYGPFTYKGTLLDQTGCNTTHGSVVQYKGNWYLFYHNMSISNNVYRRSMCIDRLYFNTDGTIQKVIQTTAGVPSASAVTATITSPISGTLSSVAPIAIHATASATLGSITRINVYANGANIGGCNGTPCNVQFTNPVEGANTIIARASTAADSGASSGTTVYWPYQPPAFPGTPIAGVRYNYYEGTWSAMPNFSTLTPVSSGVSTNFILGTSKTFSYGYSFNGYLNIAQAGAFTFFLNSDDGSKLYIDNVLVVNNDGEHDAMAQASGTIPLAVGKHAIRVEYFQSAGGASLTVKYQGPGVAQQIIPDTELFYSSSGTKTMPFVSARAIGSLWGQPITYSLRGVRISSSSSQVRGAGIVIQKYSNGKLKKQITTLVR